MTYGAKQSFLSRWLDCFSWKIIQSRSMHSLSEVFHLINSHRVQLHIWIYRILPDSFKKYNLKSFYVSCYQLFLYWGLRFIFKITKISSAVFSFGTKIGTNRFNYVILQIASGQVSLPKFAFVTIFSSVWHLSSPIVQLYLEFLNLLFSKIFAMDQIIMMKLILFDPLENDVEIGISA